VRDRRRGSLTTGTFITEQDTRVFLRELDRRYPLIERGEGVWLYDAAGTSYLDAVGGGAMVASIGHGVPELVEAARAQAAKVSFVYNQQFTSPAQEQLADELTGLAPEGFTRVHFVTGGSEANETAVRLARSYHVERGDADRWQIISPAQAYHGPTAVTLSLTGRPALHHHYTPYLSEHLHIPPSTKRLDPTGQAALEALDLALEAGGPGTVSAFFCEPVSAASLPAYSPPAAFWEGLAERRDQHGFLICLDEVVTGMGRTGSWFAAERLPFVPDVITTAKGLGAGFAPVGAVLCREEVYRAVAEGSRAFELGHTWDGAPLSCAVGLAVVRYLREHRLIEHVQAAGPRLHVALRAALADCELVGDVRGRGFLLGVEYVDPSDGQSFPDAALGVARRIDVEALERGLLVYSTQPTADGYAGDQTLLAPAFTSTDEELDLIVERMRDTVRAVERKVKGELASDRSRIAVPSPGGDASG
jgi:adenosylmethionine-8-amino-7-oxononanoate aminotransferase